MSNFQVIALKKFVTGLLIAVLCLSTLSLLGTTKWSYTPQRETEKPSSAIDTGPSELTVEPETEPELQDSTEGTAEPEQQLPTENGSENEESSSPAQSWMPLWWIPWWTYLNLADLWGQQNTPEPAQNESMSEPAQNDGLPAEKQVPEGDDGGTVKTVGVAIYSDIELDELLVSIDWGDLRPGGNKTIQCYVQNTGDTAELLFLQTDNWAPSSAADYLSLTWDYDDQPLNAYEVIPLNLTLTVAVAIQGISSFSFDITVIGSSID